MGQSSERAFEYLARSIRGPIPRLRQIRQAPIHPCGVMSLNFAPDEDPAAFSERPSEILRDV